MSLVGPAEPRLFNEVVTINNTEIIIIMIIIIIIINVKDFQLTYDLAFIHIRISYVISSTEYNRDVSSERWPITVSIKYVANVLLFKLHTKLGLHIMTNVIYFNPDWNFKKTFFI